VARLADIYSALSPGEDEVILLNSEP